MSKEKGKFNLDFEESVLLRSKISRMQKLFRHIYMLTRTILNRDSYLSEATKDMLKEIRDDANDGKGESEE